MDYFPDYLTRHLTGNAWSSVLSTTSASCPLCLMAASPEESSGRWDGHSKSISFRERSTFTELGPAEAEVVVVEEDVEAAMVLVAAAAEAAAAEEEVVKSRAPPPVPQWARSGTGEEPLFWACMRRNRSKKKKKL